MKQNLWYLDVPVSARTAENHVAYAVLSNHPETLGHTVVVSRRPMSAWTDATPDEWVGMWQLVETVQDQLSSGLGVSGFALGIDQDVASPPSRSHLLIEIVPQRSGELRLERPTFEADGNSTTLIESGAVLLDGPGRRLREELLRCLINDRFDRIDLVVSFIMKSGLRSIFGRLQDAVDRGAHLRVLTTGYLDVTDPDALTTLLDLAQRCPPGEVQVRAFDDASTSFHPKAYLFSASDGSVASGFVGSSNLSRSGIDGGVEWNLGVENVAPLLASFERLWTDPRSHPVDNRWVADYRARRISLTPARSAEVGVEFEAPQLAASPRPLQELALAALVETRSAGHAAGLVVMATGLGKTWVAAFDSTRPEFGRVLFVAHRSEILLQSMTAYRAVRPEVSLGLYTGTEKDPTADVVFASVQTLARHLDEFARNEFDYIVVDEFHHAEASSYRRVIDYFEPAFLLGLTATPDRMDGADLRPLCGDNLVFECDLVEGIRRNELVPFAYFGIKDVVDFAPIPWRNGRFDPELLASAVETEERAAQAFAEWESRAGDRTIGFCCTTAHADYMAEYFRNQGVASASVHSGDTSDPRRGSVEALAEGSIEVLFAVDIFNEGFDLPSIDTVLMLRPTASPVIFLQQLGRGLRLDPGKGFLTVIDFIGNHRSFLMKPMTLLSLGTTGFSVSRLPEMIDADPDLPPGCSVTWELGVIDLFQALARESVTAGTALEDYVLEYVREFGERPSALQAYRAGLNPGSARPNWFQWLDGLGVLSRDHASVVGVAGKVVASFQSTPVGRASKLVTLRAMQRVGGVLSSPGIDDVVRSARRIVLADPRLVEEFAADNVATMSEDEFGSLWREWPVESWTGELSGTNGLFAIEMDRLAPTFTVPSGHHAVVEDLIGELIDWRLAKCLDGVGEDDVAILRVSHSSGNPILRIDRDRNPGLPTGWTSVLMDGEPVELNFVKIAVNVGREPNNPGNALHGRLRHWFGPTAGAPGRRDEVSMEFTGGRWVMRPKGRRAGDGDNVVLLYPSFAVACGAFEGRTAEDMGAGESARPVRIDALPPSRQPFVAVASGDSMDGGTDPVSDGDLVLFDWVDGSEPRTALIGERVLVSYSVNGGREYALKDLARGLDGLELRSANPAVEPIAGSSDMTIVARYVRTLDPAALEPVDEAEPLSRKVRVDGAEIDATFIVERLQSGSLSVVIESAGGTKGSPNARNLSYVPGVDRVLERLHLLGAELVDAYVDSERTQRLPIEDRRLSPGPSGWPTQLGNWVETRKAMLRSMALVGQSSGASGSGNSRKRMRLVVGGIDEMTGRALADVLQGD